MSTAEPIWLDVSRPAAVERYLTDRGLLTPEASPIAVTLAGAGNMNVTLRVTPARGRSFIVKQGRPWVAKYPEIPAPPERTGVEAAFYQEVAGAPDVAKMMPAVIHADPANQVIVLEDVGTQGDFTPVYGGMTISEESVGTLVGWLERLARVRVGAERFAMFANRAMRALNHEHIFQFPLRKGNGLDLDAITPGLQRAADELQDDTAYCGAVAKAGQRYLADGETLVHGDFFPGSWLHASDGIRVIDPEFCFLGDPEFDCGVLVAHLKMAQADDTAIAPVARTAGARKLNGQLLVRYAGIEIMRRLIGVAQLPLSLGLDQKRALLELSRRMVLYPDKASA